MLAINRTTPFALFSSSTFACRDPGAFYHAKDAAIFPTVASLSMAKGYGKS